MKVRRHWTKTPLTRKNKPTFSQMFPVHQKGPTTGEALGLVCLLRLLRICKHASKRPAVPESAKGPMHMRNRRIWLAIGRLPANHPGAFIRGGTFRLNVGVRAAPLLPPSRSPLGRCSAVRSGLGARMG